MRKYFVGGVTGAAISFFIALLLTTIQSKPVKFADVPPDDVVAVGEMGWVPDPDEVKAVAATLEFPKFSDTPAGQNVVFLPPSVYLWDSYVKKFGKVPPVHNQGQLGSCVSFGTSRALEATFINAIVVDKAPYEFAHMFEEVIYAGSRVDVGQGRLRGSDGSVGAWAAKYVSQVGGSLPRGIYGSINGTTYNTYRGRNWGDNGVPPSLVPEISKYRSGSVTQVKSWDEAKKALAQRYGIAVCSNQGFTRQRNADGVCAPQGNWGHCMALLGYHVEADGNEYGYIQNSWGPDYHVGPVGWGTPNTGGFWANSNVVDGMLRQGDSWAYSAVKGFPAKNVSWVKLPNPRENLFNKDFALAW